VFAYPTEDGRGLDLASLPIIAFDVETAGLTSTEDRIVELAIVRLNADGVVSHHAVFEEAFIAAELGRLRIALPQIPAMCTLELSQDLFDAPNYRLESCCDWVRIEQQASLPVRMSATSVSS
jgi:DNA polymerase III epsilon subunit-like protein